MKQKITKIDFNNKIYGGRLYENDVVKLLSGDYEFERIYLMKYNYIFLNLVRSLWLLIKYKFFFTGTLFLTNSTSFFAGFRSKNIIVIHHLTKESSGKSFDLKEKFQVFCDRYFIRLKDRFSKVVVVSQYWYNRLKDLGVKNLNLIYNSFDTQEYSCSDEQKKIFRQKYKLCGKPLVYLGSCREGKGVIQSFEALRGLDIHMVTSGEKHVDLPIPNLELPFSEYKTLLASSDIIIAMSLFDEGWNRGVHEASLSGTTVVGTNKAGMNELMRLAGQIVITDFSELKDTVLQNIGREYIPTPGLMKLNLQYFEKSWRNIFENL